MTNWIYLVILRSGVACPKLVEGGAGGILPFGNRLPVNRPDVNLIVFGTDGQNRRNGQYFQLKSYVVKKRPDPSFTQLMILNGWFFV